jgi:hypothetical protein
MHLSTDRYVGIAVLAIVLLAACAGADTQEAVTLSTSDDPVEELAPEPAEQSTTDVESAIEVPPAEPLTRVVLATERGYEFGVDVFEFEPWIEPGDPGFSMVRFRGSASIENLTDRGAPATGFVIAASFDLADAPFEAGTTALGAPLLTSECRGRVVETVQYCTASGIGMVRSSPWNLTLESGEQVPVAWQGGWSTDPVFHVRDEDVSAAVDLLSTPAFLHVAVFEEGVLEGVEFTQQIGEPTRQTEVLVDVSGRMESVGMGFRSRDYRFDAKAGDEIVIEKTIGPHTASVYLYGPDEEELAEVRADRSEPITLPTTGTYVFAVSGFPNSGYEVRVIRRS